MATTEIHTIPVHARIDPTTNRMTTKVEFYDVPAAASATLEIVVPIKT